MTPLHHRFKRVWSAGNPNPAPDLATILCATYQGTDKNTTYIQPGSIWYKVADEAVRFFEFVKEDKKE